MEWLMLIVGNFWLIMGVVAGLFVLSLWGLVKLSGAGELNTAVDAHWHDSQGI